MLKVQGEQHTGASCSSSACSVLSNFCSALTTAAAGARSQTSPLVTCRREVIPVSRNRRKTTAVCPQPRVCQGTCPQGKCFWLWITCYNIPVTLLGMHSEVLWGKPVLGAKFSLWDGRNIRGIAREGREEATFWCTSKPNNLAPSVWHPQGMILCNFKTLKLICSTEIILKCCSFTCPP